MRTELLPEAKDLSDLDFTNWKRYPEWDGLVRQLDETRYVAVIPFLFTWGVVVGDLTDTTGYAERWCYSDLVTALAGASAWHGQGEPQGWHRHPASGRRRPEGDSTQEYINR